MVAGAAAGLVGVLFAQDDGMVLSGEAVGMGGQVAAVLADGVHFGDVLRDGQQIGHRAEGLAPEVHVQPGYNDPQAAQGQHLTNLRQVVIKELRFIYPNDVDALGQLQQAAGVLDRRGEDVVGIVGDHFSLIVAGVYLRLEDFYPLIGNFGALQPADQLFGLTGKHRPANDFYPSAALSFKMWL